jgi:DNA invertase Pin-like site-specific DNA recombinase
MEAGVEFSACDLPEASRFILHILAAVAAQEARTISDRTRAALQAAKCRGIKLGATNAACRNLSSEARQRGAERTAQAAADSYSAVAPIVRDLREKGLSLRRIAAELDSRGISTRNGRSWNPVQVTRVFKYTA